MFQTKRKFYVASHSPRRQRFFYDLGIDFQVVGSQKDKTVSSGDCLIPSQGILGSQDTEDRPYGGEKPEDYVKRMARTKAFEALVSLGLVSGSRSAGAEVPFFERTEDCSELSYRLETFFLPDCAENGCVVLTADTAVCLGQEILGKPKSEEEALSMLGKLKGKSHFVMTAVCFADCAQKKAYVFADKTEVYFMPWSSDLIKAYVKTGECFDKAGAYGLNAKGVFLSSAINGSWDTVVGLPVAKCVEFLLWSKTIQV